MNKDIQVINIALGHTTIGPSPLVFYTITPYLRYAKKLIIEGENSREELRLEQKWIGRDGSEEWRWVEEVRINEGGNK